MEDNFNRSDKKNKLHIAALIVIAIISITSLIMVIYLFTQQQQQQQQQISIQKELNDKNQMNVISLNLTIKKLEQSQKQLNYSFSNKYEDLNRKASGCPGVTYHFPRSNQIEDYVRYRSYVPQMKEATVCAWIESDGFSDDIDTVLSYAAHSIDNELIVFFSPQAFNTSISNQIRIDSRNVVRSFPLALSQGKFHLCTWVSSILDKAIVFVNGSKVGKHELTINGQLKGGGSLIMGQEQDLVNAQHLDPRQAFKGNITNLMIWPRVLTQQEIMSITSSCDCPPDYVVAMTTDRSELHGQVSYFVLEECPTLHNK